MRKLKKRERKLIEKIYERRERPRPEPGEGEGWPSVVLYECLGGGCKIRVSYKQNDDWTICKIRTNHVGGTLPEHFIGVSRRNPCDDHDPRRGKDVAFVHALKEGDTWQEDK
jgi:hypothetical protein